MRSNLMKIALLAVIALCVLQYASAHQAPCKGNPCGEGGTCFTKKGGWDYYCQCHKGYRQATLAEEATFAKPRRVVMTTDVNAEMACTILENMPVLLLIPHARIITSAVITAFARPRKEAKDSTVNVMMDTTTMEMSADASDPDSPPAHARTNVVMETASAKPTKVVTTLHAIATTDISTDMETSMFV
eukprot:Nk52_evm9s2485 gene=Nk52_evmTU9s2485